MRASLVLVLCASGFRGLVLCAWVELPAGN
jgi:hypothetical protein